MTWLAVASAALAILGVLYFFAAVTTAEALRPMYDPIQRTISELAVGRYGFLQISAFVALGLSLICLPAGLWRRIRRSLLSRVGIILMVAAGLASFIAAAFPTDLRGATVATVAGEVHGITAGAGYASLVTAMLLLSIHFRTDPHWRSFYKPSLGLTLAGAVALIAMGVDGTGDFAGLLQRIMAVMLLSWVMMTAMRALRLALSARAASSRD